MKCFLARCMLPLAMNFVLRTFCIAHICTLILWNMCRDVIIYLLQCTMQKNVGNTFYTYINRMIALHWCASWPGTLGNGPHACRGGWEPWRPFLIFFPNSAFVHKCACDNTNVCGSALWRHLQGPSGKETPTEAEQWDCMPRPGCIYMVYTSFSALHSALYVIDTYWHVFLVGFATFYGAWYCKGIFIFS